MRVYTGRCELKSVVRHDSSVSGHIALVSTWSMTGIDPAPGVPSEISYESVASRADADRMEAHLRSLSSVACRYYTDNPCNAPGPVVDVPPLPPLPLP
jgi:hypothetical protein